MFRYIYRVTIYLVTVLTHAYVTDVTGRVTVLTQAFVSDVTERIILCSLSLCYTRYLARYCALKTTILTLLRASLCSLKLTLLTLLIALLCSLKLMLLTLLSALLCTQDNDTDITEGVILLTQAYVQSCD